jgi:3-hydroxyacyl-[acyl-carrier-protein] dehydratase
MLLDTFFTIDSIVEDTTDPATSGETRLFQIQVTLNPEHPVFEGHFPGNPVVPGVCQLRIFTEVLSHIMEKSMELKEADQVKFLSMINPSEHLNLTLAMQCKSIENDGIKLIAGLASGEKKFLKFKAHYYPTNL